MNAQTSDYQLSVNVRRVVIDVVVTDANGNPVEGLKQDDFKVMEDGAIQPIRFFDVNGFDAHSAAAGASQQALDLNLPPHTFSNLTLAPPGKPVTVLLYDMLDTPEASLPSAHRALVKFIKDQGHSTKIAVFVLTDHLHMLQGFTDDETRLTAAINSKGATSKALPLRAEPFLDLTDVPLVQLEIEEMLYLGIKRNRATVDAFIEIARFVSALPGRKNLIWMSGSFPPEIFSNGTGNPGSQWQVKIDPYVRAAKKLLDENRVAVYPVDVRGLQVDPQFSASINTATLEEFNLLGPPLNYFGLQQGAKHASMDVIADSTGGRAFYNTNGLQEAADAAVRQGSAYYTLTYAPTHSKADGGERNIKVVLKNPIYQLSYRKSYLADDARSRAPIRPLLLDMDMEHGAPNSSELFFEAKVNPAGGVMLASEVEAREVNRFLQSTGKGKHATIGNGPQRVQHYDINFAIVGRQLQMPAVAGGYATDMRFALAAYTSDSELLNGVEIRVRNSIPAAQYQKIESEGYHAAMQFVVPEAAVSLRMAVRDEIGNRIGTMEVQLPIAKTTEETNPLAN